MEFFKEIFYILRTRFKVGLIAIAIFIPILIIVGIVEGVSDSESEMPGSEVNSYYEGEDEHYEIDPDTDIYLEPDIPDYEYDGSTGKTFDDIRDEMEYENELRNLENDNYDYDESDFDDFD